MYSSSYSNADASGAILGGLFGYLAMIALVIFMYWCMCKLYEKMGYKSWYALCPGYNEYLLYKAVWGDGWKFLLMWIPFYNIYLAIKTMIGLSKAFGHGVGFGLGLIFLEPIFLAILALNDDQYEGNPYEA